MMAASVVIYVVTCCILLAFVHIILADIHRAVIKITPTSFLPGVSRNVEIACAPPHGEDIAHVLLFQLYRKRRQAEYLDPVASFDTSDRPLVESLGASIGFSASGSYNTSDLHSTSLRLELLSPTGEADGLYMCSVETLDSMGLVHRYDGSALLTSLVWPHREAPQPRQVQNESVPQFYHSILQELRRDLDVLSVDLNNVSDVHHSVQNADKEIDAKLSTIDGQGAKIQTLINGTRDETQAVNQLVTSMRADIRRLDRITPDSPVNFYVYLSSSYTTFSNGAPFVFNALQQHTDTGYSKSTGVFTAPVNGTYRFITGITGHTNTDTAASITVNGKVVMSLFSSDDYQFSQGTAHVVVQLAAGDKVKVIQKQGGRIYGVSNGDHYTYFIGLLLW